VSLSPVPTPRAPAARWEPSDGWDRALDDVVSGRRPVTLHAQPIVNLAAADVAGYELLSRFGEGTPDQWFAAARHRGRGPELDLAVLRSALTLRATLPANRFLTVNVEPEALSVLDLPRLLAEAGVRDLAGLVVELTEHRPMPEDDAALACLARLRDAGALVAMDDAGTGYAGLAHLMRLRPDLVKVDRDLVAGVDADPARRRLLELLGDLCGQMDAWLLAEGVETAAENDVVLALGIPLAQGWHYARPAPPWPELDEGVRDGLLRAAARIELAEHVASVMRALDADPSAPFVVLDGHGRPRAVRWDAAGLPAQSPAMTMAASTPLEEALRRALTRPVQDRWAPFLVTDGQGTPRGFVEVADLALRASSRDRSAPMRTV